MSVRVPGNFHSRTSDVEFRQHGIDRGASIVERYLLA